MTQVGNLRHPLTNCGTLDTWALNILDYSGLSDYSKLLTRFIFHSCFDFLISEPSFTSLACRVPIGASLALRLVKALD